MFTRRIFLMTGAAAGASLVIGITGCAPRNHSLGADLNMWVAVGPDGITTIRVNAVDIGQGAQTGLAQIVADELDADWHKVRVEMAPVTGQYMVKDGADYYTGGSSSIHGQFGIFAQAGATARHLLVAAAAQQWDADHDACRTQNGFVYDPDGKRRLSYGELAPRAAGLAFPKNVALKQRKNRTLVGKPMPRIDIPAKVNGATIYGIDVKVPGMLIATMAQSPFFGGKLASVDEKPARAVKGVRHVVKLDNAVIVAATNFYAAKTGLLALDPQWTKPADAMATQDALIAALKTNIGAADSQVVVLPGKDKPKTIANVNAAMAGGAKLYEADYQAQFLSHSPMEPMNATVHVTGAGCEVWVSTQVPGDIRRDLAKALSLPVDAIDVHPMKVGGGFGRRLKTDYVVFAAQASKAIGAPVKLIWTREEDMTHDFYRPASVCRLRVALNTDKTIRAIDYTGATANDTALGGIAWNYPSGDIVLRQKQTTLQVPVGAWRSVDPSITIFFIESMIDEIAHGEGLDPLAYRRMLLAKDARALRTLNAAAEMANWGKAPKGRVQGLAFFHYHSWGTSTAHVVEMSVNDKSKITIHKIFSAIDPGLAINPNQIVAQTEGGIILGLSAALREQITLKDGRVEQTNFDTYPALRLANIPEIEVTVLETDGAEAGGVGEPPVPPIAPAVANAIFAATGRRIRELPLCNASFTI